MKPKLTLIRGGRYDEPKVAPVPAPASTPTPPPKRESLYDILVQAEGRKA
jgi:hypothetical protein